MDILPRHVICILGRWRDFSVVQAAVEACGEDFTFDVEYSQLSHDDRMDVAFAVSVDGFRPSLTAEDRENIRSHSGVAYVLSPPMQQSDAEEISGRTLLLTAALLESGGLAAKSESAGLAHGRAKWIELARQYSAATAGGDLHGASASLYQAWVQRPIHDSSTATFYSVGMHLLGRPDTEIDDSLAPEVAVEWIDLLGLYLVADKPNRPLLEGEGFRCRNDGPRRILKRLPCRRYEEDEFFFNPYGYNRLAPL